MEIADKTGSSHPLVAAALHDLASVYVNQKRYADAESLYKRAIEIRQTSFGLEHPSVGTSELNLAGLYALQGRIADALPLIRHIATLSRNDIRPAKWFIFALLYGASAKNLISKDDAIAESWTVLQRGFSSSTGDAISKLSARFGAGNNELARLIRHDQDLTAEEQRLDNELIGRRARLRIPTIAAGDSD